MTGKTPKDLLNDSDREMVAKMDMNDLRASRKALLEALDTDGLASGPVRVLHAYIDAMEERMELLQDPNAGRVPAPVVMVEEDDLPTGERCPSCGGSGLVRTSPDDADTCMTCDGSGYVRPDDPEYPRCRLCGDPVDYCQGHSSRDWMEYDAREAMAGREPRDGMDGVPVLLVDSIKDEDSDQIESLLEYLLKQSMSPREAVEDAMEKFGIRENEDGGGWELPDGRTIDVNVTIAVEVLS